MLVLCLLVFGGALTYSSFFSAAKLEGHDQKIANFIFNAEQGSLIELPLLNMLPGNQEDYLFSVTNTANEKNSETLIKYQISIKTYHFIPLELKLYKVNESSDVLIGVCDETFSRNDKNELVCDMPIQEMSHSQTVVDNYKLVVSFPRSGFDTDAYAGLVDFLNLEIKSWQKTEN